MTYSKLTFTPVSYTGWGAIDQLIPEINKYQPRHILIVTDPVLYDNGIAKQVTIPLEKSGIAFTIYTEVTAEPSLQTGEDLVAYTKKHKFDFVIGLGGGSALDLAKLAAVLSAHEGAVADYFHLTGTKQILHKGLPKLLIPTTSGTGSEVTNISVLSLAHTKDVVTHDYLLADASIVDPQLTLTVPSKVTAATGIDALTHAVEAYVSVHASPTTDGLALHAIRLISRSLRTAVQDGQNKEARTDLSHGSYMAGLAFFNAGVAGVHALAYPLGGQFHLSHGVSNAVLLPYVMGYIRSSCTERMAQILKVLSDDYGYMSEEDASVQCVKELENIVSDVGIPLTVKELGVPETAVRRLTEDGIRQKRLLARSPMELGLADIQKIYQAAFDGIMPIESRN